MDESLYELHLEAGRIAGQVATCGNKHAYGDESAALKAAQAHNQWDKRHHDVEPYSCAFCSQWHVGKIMPIEVLQSIVEEHDSSNSKS